jgi:hypothetical protein
MLNFNQKINECNSVTIIRISESLGGVHLVRNEQGEEIYFLQREYWRILKESLQRILLNGFRILSVNFH